MVSKSKAVREILFRGKCVDTGIWYEGGYIHLHKTTHCPIGDPERFPDNDIHQIVFERMTDWELPNQHLRVDVNLETVGQFTGLTDKNGKRIFEGDILEERIRGRPLKDGTPGYKTRKYIVRFGGWSFYLEAIGASGRPSRCVERCKIIGNIHDNPELLEGCDG